MNIEFLFTDINDKSKLYLEEIYEETSRFTGETTENSTIEYVGKTYCTTAIESLMPKIPAIKKCEYKGCLERIANEVFELTSDETIYTISCTIDTYNSKKTRMLIRISTAPTDSTNSTNSVNSDLIDSYDQLLEKLKLETKNVFRSDWNSCIWIKDEQSEFLSSNLYPCIFRAENRLRAFANKLLIWELGSDWLQNPGLEKYAESHKNLCEDFRNREPAFSNVDDVFISTTLETLFEIIQKGVVYESPFTLTKEQLNELFSIVRKADKQDNITNWIKKKRIIKKNLWKDVFEPYFIETENSQQIITDFIKNRNHIAHNKPITLSAYRTMLKSFSDLDDMIKNANDKFEESVPSEELYLTIDIQNEQAQEAEEQKEYEKNYLRDRIQGETGVEILWRDSIFEMFIERTDCLYETFHDMYYWDSRFTVCPMCSIEDSEQWQTLFAVQCNANKDYYIEVQVQIVIDDEMDGDSCLSLRYLVRDSDNDASHDNTFTTASINYHNGNGYEDLFEGTVQLYSESSLDETEMDSFIEELQEKIEEFNPYIALKETMEMDMVRNGDPAPVADFPCWECEKYGISLREDFYKFGHCCYCGTDNEIHICERCETPYGDGGGSMGLCNSCRDEIENE